MTLAETTGTSTTLGGQLHSWERPTRDPASPKSATISVALGNSETIRIAGLP